MKSLLTGLLIGCLGAPVIAQVDIDKPINLSGNPGDRSVTNLELPVNDGDAANKKYVDDQISANSGGAGHTIGELYGGGVVFVVHQDAEGAEHGLIVSLVDNSSGAAWSNVTGSLVGTNSWNGAANTAAIVGQSGHSSSAARICDDYTGGGNSDWFLPATSQLNMLWNELYVINYTLASTGGAQVMATDAYYWPSTEAAFDAARRQHFDNGLIGASAKASSYRVRCVRAY